MLSRSNHPSQPRSRGAFRRWFSGLALAAVALAGIQQASATVVPLTLEELVAVSDEIITVKVGAQEATLDGRMIVTDSQLVIVDSFKGVKGRDSSTTTLTTPGGNVGGLVMAVPGYPSLKEGDEAILFLSYPENRLSKERRATLNTESKLVRSAKLVGGWQGKIDLVSITGDGATETTEQGRTAVRSSAYVGRFQGMSPTDPRTITKNNPTYEDFSRALRELVAQERSLKGRDAGAKEIKGINGRFHVPARSKNLAVRSMDPLPSMAYLTPEEFKALETEVRQRALEAQEARKASTDTDAELRTDESK